MSEGLSSIQEALGSIHSTTESRVVVHAYNSSTQEVEAGGSEIQMNSVAKFILGYRWSLKLAWTMRLYLISSTKTEGKKEGRKEGRRGRKEGEERGREERSEGRVGSEERREAERRRLLTYFVSKAHFQMWRVVDDITVKEGITARGQNGSAQ